ncbi:MAG: phosphatase PAP2 family protein [Polyangiales bacterium]
MTIRRRLTAAYGVVSEHCSLVDIIIFGYLSALTIAAWRGSGPLRNTCIASTMVMLVTFVGTVAFARGPGAGQRVAAYAYRAVILVDLLSSYLLLRWLLPTARDDSYDMQLLQIDRTIFGVEPTQWLERWVTPYRTEWFALFYMSYFGILAAHFLPMLFRCRNQRLVSEFGLAVITLFCMGNLLYMVVPGFGPYRHVAYAAPLPSGTFQNLMSETVASAGAQKDIFPSLHTALPTLFSLFAFRHRALTPWRYTWPVVSFFAANIVIATLYLRWHYAIDVIAGLTLAIVISRVAPTLAAREEMRRRARGIPACWPALDETIPGR